MSNKKKPLHRRILSAAAALCVGLCMIPAGAIPADAAEVGDIIRGRYNTTEYEVIDDSHLKLIYSHFWEEYPIKAVLYDNNKKPYTVTTIGERAVYGGNSIPYIVTFYGIGSEGTQTVQYIEDYAFYHDQGMIIT